MRKRDIMWLLIGCVFLGGFSACGTKQPAPNEVAPRADQGASAASPPLRVSDNAKQREPEATTKGSSARENGYVPDEQTAIAIAVAVWSPIYGKEKIEGE